MYTHTYILTFYTLFTVEVEGRPSQGFFRPKNSLPLSAVATRLTSIDLKPESALLLLLLVESVCVSAHVLEASAAIAVVLAAAAAFVSPPPCLSCRSCRSSRHTTRGKERERGETSSRSGRHKGEEEEKGGIKLTFAGWCCMCVYVSSSYY